MAISKYQNPAIDKDSSLDEIIITPDTKYNVFLNSLPKNQKYTPESKYSTYKYWKLWGKPKDFKYTLTHPDKNGLYMYTWNTSDQGYHANSIAWEDEVGYFMKPKDHPTLKYELDYYNDGLITEENGTLRKVTGKEKEDWLNFKNLYDLDTSGNFYKYIPKNQEGGEIKYSIPVDYKEGIPVSTTLEILVTPKGVGRNYEVESSNEMVPIDNTDYLTHKFMSMWNANRAKAGKKALEIGLYTLPPQGDLIALGEDVYNAVQATPRLIFNHLPYRTINELRYARPYTKLKPILLSKIEDPVLPSGITPNSNKSVFLLLKNRYKWREDHTEFSYLGPSGKGRFTDYDAPGASATSNVGLVPRFLKNLDKVTVKEYLPVREVYSRLRDSDGVIKSALKTPKWYFKLNMKPGFRYKDLIFVNPKQLRDYGFDYNRAANHEIIHFLDSRTPIKLPKTDFPKGFDYSHLSDPSYFKEHNNAEIVVRGSQLKDYFGIEDDTPLTVDMLKYAYNHYIKDTKFNNNMRSFFSGITNWEDAAKYLSTESLKNGGSLAKFQEFG